MLIPSPMCTIYTGITFECLYCINCAYFPVDCCMACSLWRLCAGNCHSGENEYSCFSVMSVWGWIAFAPYFPLGCCRCCCCFTALLPTQTAKSLVILCVGCRGVITTAVLHTSFSHKCLFLQYWLHVKPDLSYIQERLTFTFSHPRQRRPTVARFLPYHISQNVLVKIL